MFFEHTFGRALQAVRQLANPVQPTPQELDEVFQASTLDALLEGVYDGEITFGELKKHGDFGLGTFDALDGEMLAFDGQFYQVKSDGSVHEVRDEQKTPFAAVLFFQPTTRRAIEETLDFPGLEERIDRRLPTKNIFYALRIDGFFPRMTTRSVPRQTRPYPPLVEVAKSQPIFKLENVGGTMVGFRFPDYASGFNVPGYHLHFLSEDKTCGGHVLDFSLDPGALLSIDPAANFHLELPKSKDFMNADLEKDHRADIEQAERNSASKNNA